MLPNRNEKVDLSAKQPMLNLPNKPTKNTFVFLLLTGPRQTSYFKFGGNWEIKKLVYLDIIDI